MTSQLYKPRHLACMNSNASASGWLTSILIFLHSNMMCPRMKQFLHTSLFFTRGEDVGVSPSHSSIYETRCMGRDNMGERCRSCRFRYTYSHSGTYRSTGSEEV